MGHSGYESRTNCQKRYIAKSKSNGTCKDCSDKSKEGSSRCQYHLDLQGKYRANKKAREATPFHGKVKA